MSTATAPNTSSALKRAACVVLQPRSAPVPESARRWLADRGWECVVANEPLLALAALCVIERGQAQRAAWGLQRHEHIALLVIESMRWPELDALLRAMQQHLPQAAVWTLRGAEDEVAWLGGATILEDMHHPAIAPDVECEADSAVGVSTGDAGVGLPSMAAPVGAAPALMSAAGLEPETATVSDDSADERRITREEIAMLLDDRYEEPVP